MWRSGGTWGFIRPDEGAEDLFVHFSALEGVGGYRQLGIGQRVTFERTSDPQGRSLARAVQLEDEAA